MRSGRISKEEALSFLLTHIVVERGISLTLNQLNLFNIMTLAAEAESKLAEEEGLIPHEVIESLASRFVEEL